MIIFGAVGAGYFVYGRKQKHAPALIAGIGLIALPYIVKNTWAVLSLGLALCALPWIIKKYF